MFDRFVARLVSLADPATELPLGYVHTTQLWWIEADDYLGRLSIRHELTDALLSWGGHIGYAVRGPERSPDGAVTCRFAGVCPAWRG